ncbi:MAG: Hpt domain-containing protein [Calditrichaceae bacterium]
MISQKNLDIPFNIFFLVEFFENALEKGRSVIPEKHYSMLDELSGYLLQDEDVIHGLEKLAQHQGTNEIAIFLFDMVERVNDYEPDMVYQTLPDLADDFVNLYNLMTEDQESITAINKVLEDFRLEQPEDQQKKESAEIVESETKAEGKTEELFNFDHFYRLEFFGRLEKKFEALNDEDKSMSYISFFNIIMENTQESAKKLKKKYDPEIVHLITRADELLPDVIDPRNAVEMMDTLDEKLDKFVGELENFAEKSGNQFFTILENQRLPEYDPKKEKLKKEEKKATKEEISKKEFKSLENLLGEYFQTELNDNISEVLNILESLRNEPENRAFIATIIKQIKSLKEVSMIHGYSGIENLSSGIIRELNYANNNDKIFSESTFLSIESILNRFTPVDRFLNISKDDELLISVQDQISGLRDTFEDIIPEIPEEEMPQEIAPEMEPAGLPEFQFEDKKAMGKIFGELFNQVAKKIRDEHLQINEKDAFNRVLDLLGRLKFASALMGFSSMISEFLEPMETVYGKINGYSGENMKEVIAHIQTSWKKTGQKDFSLESIDSSDLSNIFDSVHKLLIPEPELYEIDNDEQVVKALAESMLRKWKHLKGSLGKSILKNSEADRAKLVSFFDLFGRDLKNTRCDNYLEPVKFFEKIVSRAAAKEYSKDIVFEIEKSFGLLLERLNYQGKYAASDDIISVLSEIIEELPEMANHKADDGPGEEDLNSIFRSEAMQSINIARAALTLLEADKNNREAFAEIENAMHSIKSSAHLMDLKDVVNLSSLIEEISEIFGKIQVDVPANVPQALDDGFNSLEALIKNPETETETTMEMLQNTLDKIEIVDGESSEVSETAEKITIEESDDEKPLFSSSKDTDTELVEIFQDEARTFLATINKSHEKIKKKPKDKNALNELENASHSLKLSARMMGFEDISHIAESLESMVESVRNNEIEIDSGLQENITLAVDYISRLSSGEKISKSDLEGLLDSIDVKSFKTELSEEPIENEEPETVPDSIKEIFLEEAGQLIEDLNKELLELEKMPESDTIMADVLRNVHTLKGSSLMSTYSRIGEVSHKLEDYFQLYKLKKGGSKSEMLNPAFTAIDLIQDLLASIQRGEGENVPLYLARISELDNKLFLYQNMEELPDELRVAEIPAAKVPAKRSEGIKEEEKNIRVSTDYLDKLVDMAADLVINQTQLSTYLDTFKKIISDIESGKKKIYSSEDIVEEVVEEDVLTDGGLKSFDPEQMDNLKILSGNFKDILKTVSTVSLDLNRLTQGVEQSVGRISNLSKQLHGDILKARMVPIEYLFNRYPRAVRDLAKSQNKKINLVIAEQDVDLDRAMVEALSDPLMHIIRNAIDHGIELPKDRKKLKKSESGNLYLRARQERNQVVVEVEDDGQGIDLGKIKSKIISKKMADRKEVDQLSEAEILDYIFYPGFSTRDQANEISGRGIGMDVVANEIQKLKGNIRIKTEKNVGTTFSIRVPLTLIISQAIMIRTAGQIVAIPMIAIQESIRFDQKDLILEGEKTYIKIRGKLLPYLEIDKLLEFKKEESGQNKFNAVVLHDAGVSIALGVDEIIGRLEIVIKTLGSHLQNVEYVSGGTILGNGEVALILDYSAVIRTAELQFFGSIADKYSGRKTRVTIPEAEKIKKPKPAKKRKAVKKEIKKKKISSRKPQILIVDDSSSVRNFVGSVLEKHNFTIVKSNNGEDALTKIKSEKIDLMITDLEMPKMHGFELIKSIRKNKKYEGLPIVILTGRAGMSQQQEGEEIGANAFLVKPFKESDLIRVLSDFIEIGS